MRKSYPNLKASNHPKNTQWKLDVDPSFIKTLKDKAAKGDVESIKALEFYDAYFRAELSANFQSLEAITDVPKNLKTEMSRDRDRAKADLFVDKTILECEITPNNDESLIPEYNSIFDKAGPLTIGEIKEGTDSLKRKNISQGMKNKWKKRKVKSQE